MNYSILALCCREPSQTMVSQSWATNAERPDCMQLAIEHSSRLQTTAEDGSVGRRTGGVHLSLEGVRDSTLKNSFTSASNITAPLEKISSTSVWPLTLIPLSPVDPCRARQPVRMPVH